MKYGCLSSSPRVPQDVPASMPTDRDIAMWGLLETMGCTAAFAMPAPTITNLYVVSALATIGGLLQGFDVASLSAILATAPVSCHLFS